MVTCSYRYRPAHVCASHSRLFQVHRWFYFAQAFRRECRLKPNGERNLELDRFVAKFFHLASSMKGGVDIVLE